MGGDQSFWQHAVVYQIYPWTFKEDEARAPQWGVGSLQGIASRLDYLQNDLGVDAIWLTPFYDSPMADGGYDVSDYLSVNPLLGSMEDFDQLVRQVHGRDMKLMVDFVPNHTSDRHEWFQKSRSKIDGYDDWYMWHPGIVGDSGERKPPNNWASVRSMPNKIARQHGEMPWLNDGDPTPSVSAWQWDESRQEYYLRSFAKEQPDLNWSNPNVREAMKDIIRFWLDKGVDGFRVDAINYIGKNSELVDEKQNPAYEEQSSTNPYDQLIRYNSCNYMPALVSYVKEICDVANEQQYSQRDIRITFEAYADETELHILDDVAPKVASTFNFGPLTIGWKEHQHKIQLDHYYGQLRTSAIGNQVNGNHDKPRLATRIGDGEARAAAVLSIMLPGMKFIYNGEELGLHDALIPEGRVLDHEAFRDGARTPMIWDDQQPNGGFSNAEPKDLWLPTNRDDMQLAVSRQRGDAVSSLALYHALLRMNHGVESGYGALETDNDNILAFSRGDTFIIMVNFSFDEQKVVISNAPYSKGHVELSSTTVSSTIKAVDMDAGFTLSANEAIVVTRRSAA